jgi:hypothetical protein
MESRLDAILEMLFDVTKPDRGNNDGTRTCLDSVFAIDNKSERDDADRRLIKAAELVGPRPVRGQ